LLRRQIERTNNSILHHLLLAAAYGQMGRVEDAARAAEAVRQIGPVYKTYMQFRRFENAADIEHIVEGLSKAGLDRAD